MSTRRLLAALASLGVAAALLALLPLPAAAHALGGVFTLPVPLGLYLTAAGAAVAASFVVAVVVVRPAHGFPAYPVRILQPIVGQRASRILVVVGLVWWFGIILLGLVVDPISPFPAALFWILIWAGLPVGSVLIGNPWPSLSPFRTLFNGLERLAKLIGFDRLDAGMRYPEALGRWPVVALLFAAEWCELVLPNRTLPTTISALLIGYTLLTLVGMALYGRIAWLRNAELFEVYLGWLGRVAPIGRRVVEKETCSGCSEGCSPEHCVDCPECAIAAEPGERRVELRPYFTGLTEVGRAGWWDAAFIVLILSGITFDGLSSTSPWATLINWLFNLLLPVIGALNTVLVVQTIGLVGLWVVFLGAFTLAATLTRRLDGGRTTEPMGSVVGGYAATLLPIAAGYLIAHYLTYVVQGIVWLPGLIADPVTSTAPLLDWLPISGVWYLSVGAIVIGHIAAVVLAHRRALRDSTRPIIAGLPLVLLMVGYTVLSLWIIAQPITLEPGKSQPTALVLPR